MERSSRRSATVSIDVCAVAVPPEEHQKRITKQAAVRKKQSKASNSPGSDVYDSKRFYDNESCSNPPRTKEITVDVSSGRNEMLSFLKKSLLASPKVRNDTALVEKLQESVFREFERDDKRNRKQEKHQKPLR